MTPQSEYLTYWCGICGAGLDCDTNAAVNVLHRALGPTGAGIPPVPSGARTVPFLATG